MSIEGAAADAKEVGKISQATNNIYLKANGLYTKNGIFNTITSESLLPANYTDYIPCNPGDIFFVQGQGNYNYNLVSFYDAYKNFVSGIQSPAPCPQGWCDEIEVPTGVAFATFCSYRTNKHPLKVVNLTKEESITSLSKIKENDLANDIELLQANSNELETTVEEIYNLLNPDKKEKGYYSRSGYQSS